MPPDEAILDEGAVDAAPEDAPDTTDAAVDAPEAPADAPVTFTAEQLAEHLPQFQERFLAHHDPAEALALYGQRDRNVQAALTRYTQGNATDGDVATLRDSGYEVPEPAEPEPAEPIWGAPWSDPSDYDGIIAMVQTDPARAMAFIDKQPEGVIDPTFRQQVLAYWANPEGGNDPAGMVAYEREQARVAAISEAKAYAEQIRDELREEMTPIHQRAAAADHAEQLANVTILASRARSEVPDFNDHEDGVIKLLQERADYDPSYLPRLFALSMEQQLQEIYDLTGVAAWRSRPAAVAEAEAAAAATEQAKAAAGGQRARGAAGSSNAPMSQAKRDHLAAFERLKDVEIPIR